VLGQGCHEVRRDEPLVQREHPARCDQRVQDEVLAEAMKHRYRAKAAVLRRHPEVMNGGVGIGDDVGVAQHHPFRPAGGGRRVEDGRRLVAIALERAHQAGTETGEVRGLDQAPYRGHGPGRGKVAGNGRRRNHCAGRRVAQDVAQLLRLVGHVQ
jgi:hypothetical protein